MRRWKRPASRSTPRAWCGSRTGRRGAARGPALRDLVLHGARARGRGHRRRRRDPRAPVDPPRRRDRAGATPARSSIIPPDLDDPAAARPRNRSVDAALAAARARDPQIYVTHIARVDGGIVSMWQGDAGYDDGDATQAGAPQPPADARRRLAGRDLLTDVLDSLRRARIPGARRVVSRTLRRARRVPDAPAHRWLDGTDLSWARRLVVVVTAVALLAVACSGGGGSDQAQTTTTAARQRHERDRPHRRPRRRPPRRRSTRSRACRACPTRRTSTARPRPARSATRSRAR